MKVLIACENRRKSARRSGRVLRRMRREMDEGA